MKTLRRHYINASLHFVPRVSGAAPEEVIFRHA